MYKAVHVIVCVWERVYMCIFTKRLCHKQDVTQAIFEVVYNWFDFRDFLFLDWLPNQS